MSGTSVFNPPLADISIEVYERCGIRAAALTAEHFISCRRSMNFVQSRWSNRGVNLWKVSLVATLMNQGQTIYPVDPAVADVLDTYIRQYQMGSPENIVPAFTTSLGSATVTIAGLTSTPVAGTYISVIVPVSIGGLVIQGFYAVVSAPTSGSCTITAASVATSAATGGSVPSFGTTGNSTSVAVLLNNHGLLAGQTFTVQVTTQVGGLVLQGPYTISSVTDANNFVITSPSIAGASQTVTENSGLASIAQAALVQGFTQNADPVDILLYPLSRNEYTGIPDKSQQGRPTSYWWDRAPTTGSTSLNVWPLADGNGPYELRYYVFSRIQDAEPAMGNTADVPWQFYEAYAAEVAAHLAVKWAPDRFAVLSQIASAAWQEAADENREKTPWRISPEFSAYYD